MPFIYNIPFICIVISIVVGLVSTLLKSKPAKYCTVFLVLLVFVLNTILLIDLSTQNNSFHFNMGHYPSPWGNQLRGGILEALICCVLSIVMLLSILSGLKKLNQHIDIQKSNFFFVMLDITLAAVVSIFYTNDLFTGYVFIEILTITSCFFISARQVGHSLVASMRYMIMSLLGSGLILLGISLLYNITGHLLMEDIHQSLISLMQTNQYNLVITVIIGLFFVGFSIKCGLFPFHTWLPDAYGYATPLASSVLSSVISKTYIFLFLKILLRVIGIEIINIDHALNLFLVFGLLSMVFGSLSAIKSNDIRRMVAFSSITQIGYIFAAFGIGTLSSISAGIFHLIVHSISKSMLFISANELSDSSNDSKNFISLRGAGYRNPVAGLSFSIGAMSLVGIPILGGFFSKIYLTSSAVAVGGLHGWVFIGTIAISTLLNALYFLRTIIGIYRTQQVTLPSNANFKLTSTSIFMLIMCFINILFCLVSSKIMSFISSGLDMFM